MLRVNGSNRRQQQKTNLTRQTAKHTVKRIETKNNNRQTREVILVN